MNDHPIHINDENFEKAVLQSPLPVLVDFWAPWCRPCHMVAPILEQLAKEYADQLVVAKVNTDDDQQWAIHYGVQGIPTLLLVKGGQEVNRIVGAMPYAPLKEKVDALLAASAMQWK